MLTAIRTAAGRYGMSAELTGVATGRRWPNGSMQPQPSQSAPPRVPEGSILADWAAARTFSTTRLRPGYDQEQVNAFVGAIRGTFLGVREPPLTSDEIRNKKFSTTRLRPGYDEEEVDALLDEAETRLAALSRRAIDNLE
jgi:DivIVA domain-containing protein